MIRVTANTEAVIHRLRKTIERMSDLSVPLTRAGNVVRNDAVWRIKQQGGDQVWVPNKRGGHTGIDTGRMWQSIQVGQPNGRSIQVGTNVRYARFFQEGTGIFAGHSPWTIVPKKGKALAFSIGGAKFVRRSVTIQGQPARPFLLISDTARAKIRGIFKKWIVVGSDGS